MGAGGEAGFGPVVQGVVGMTMNADMKQSMVHDVIVSQLIDVA